MDTVDGKVDAAPAPLEVPEARNACDHRLAIDHEGERVAELQAERFLQFGTGRDERLTGLISWPPFPLGGFRALRLRRR